jgi:phage terminase large subunit
VKARLRSQRLAIFEGAVASRDSSLVDVGKPAGTAEEVPGYVWRQQVTVGNPRDEPLKENDHGCDAMRYVVSHLDITGSVGVRFLGS